MENTPTSRIETPWSRFSERIAIIGFWGVLALLEVLRRMLDPFRPEAFGINWIAGSVTEYVIWAVLTPFIFRLAERNPLDRGSITRKVLIHLGIGLAIAIAVETVMFSIIRFLMFQDGVAPHGPPRVLPFLFFRFGFMDEVIIYLAILGIGYARINFIRLRERDRETAMLTAETGRLQAQLSDARLATLRMQLNPHFLFNTLNAVSSLADTNPAAVQRVVARLSSLLRRTLEGNPRQEVPLSAEMDFLRDYLEIQKIRFDDRLQLTLDVDPATLDALVPNMILQPLVENAIEHGVDQKAGTNLLVIASRLDASGQLVLEVRDSGPGMKETAETIASRRGRIGLRNTRERLEAIYGVGAALDLQVAPEGGVAAVISIPYHTAQDLRTSVL